MYRIINKKCLNPTVTLMDIEAPPVAKKAQPGQFIILRTDSEGERIPLTVAGYDRERGTVRIIFQIVGATTYKLNLMETGDELSDFVGPLGVPSKLDGLKKVLIVGGGVGCASLLLGAEETGRELESPCWGSVERINIHSTATTMATTTAPARKYRPLLPAAPAFLPGFAPAMRTGAVASSSSSCSRRVLISCVRARGAACMAASSALDT